MKKRKNVLTMTTLLAATTLLNPVVALADTIDVINPAGKILIESAEIQTDENGNNYVALGNGFLLYGGEDGELGTDDDLVQGFGSYPVNDETGEIFDALNWRILDIQDGKAVLVSQYCLNAVFFSLDEKAGIIDWENSNLRAWLNSNGGESFKGDTIGFYDAAFTEEEKSKIALSDVRMDYSDWPLWTEDMGGVGYDGAVGTFPVYDKLKPIRDGLTENPWNLMTTEGVDTQDYVYALSGEEVYEYFGEPEERLYEMLGEEFAYMAPNYTNAYFECSPYAVAQGAKYNGGSQEQFFYNCDTWLRSQGSVYEGVAYGSFLGSNGDIDTGREVNLVQQARDDGHEITYGTLPVIQVVLE